MARWSEQMSGSAMRHIWRPAIGLVPASGRCIAVAIALVVFGLAGGAVNADDLDGLRSLWRSGEYARAYDGLKLYRRTTPYGKTPEVHYMIGTSLCRLDATTDLGCAYLKWILDNQSVSEPERKVVERELSRCTTREYERPVIVYFNDTRSTAGVGGRTKMFFSFDSRSVLASEPVDVVRPMAQEVIESRLFESGRRAEAIRYVGDFLGTRSVVVSSPHIVLGSTSGQDKAELTALADTLERTLRFFVEEYGVWEPNHLILAYWLKDSEELQNNALELHGIRLSHDSVGYSYRDDLSLLASAASGSGTLLHELFHLTIGSNFADIPPWLDEGVASLYEQCEIRSERIVGLPNWRGEILSLFWNERPTVAKLVSMNWPDFNAQGWDVERQTLNHAMARYLVLYFQDTGVLKSIVARFRDRDIGSDPVEVLEAGLGSSAAEIDRAFAAWFERSR